MVRFRRGRLPQVVALAALVSAGMGGAAGARVSPSVLAAAEDRLVPYFEKAGVVFPPAAVTLVALKREARLEVWAESGEGWRFVRSYLVRSSSGRLGPKLRSGDHQVPEGIYHIAALKPDSQYHLAMRLDYPNTFDRARAAAEGRRRLGGNIMIHGSNVSDGCLPVGDTAIEEIYALTDRVGSPNVTAIVSPVDLRRVDPSVAVGQAAQRPSWLRGLYADVAAALGPFALPPEPAPVAAPARLRVERPRCRAYDARDCARRCAAGDAASCARAGLMAARGARPGGERTATWTFLETACAGGDAFGCGELGRLYAADDGGRLDAPRAAALAQVACDGGDGHGCIDLATLCTERTLYPAPGDPCSPEVVRGLHDRAVAMLRTDCSGWGAYDCYGLARIYVRGDRYTALRFAAGACKGGDPGGCDGLARLYEAGGDAAAASALYTRACAAGYGAACAHTGVVTAHAVAALR